ncbi:MAG: hypothetical protein ACXWMJ_03640 [Syntrophales bacterium]
MKYDDMIVSTTEMPHPSSEFESERIPRSVLRRGKRANAKRYCSLRIEESQQLAAESFNTSR